jgi:hypothetical protein
MSEQQQPRLWRVTVLEWLSHVTIIEADTAEEAEEKALELREVDIEAFRHLDSGLDGVVVEEA